MIASNLKIDIIDFYVLYELYSISHMRLAMLEQRVNSIIEARHDGDSTHLDRIESRVSALTDLGYVQCVTAHQLNCIKSIVEAGAFSVDSCDLPQVGVLDLTIAGASLMTYIKSIAFSTNIFEEGGVRVSIGADDVGFLYSNSKSECDAFEDADVVFLEDTESCGPWLDRWWRVYPKGFRRRVRYVWK